MNGGSQNSVHEDSSLLGCYTMLSKNTSISNKFVASIFRVLALQGEYTHKMKAAISSKILITTYQSLWSYTTGEYIFNSFVIASLV